MVAKSTVYYHQKRAGLLEAFGGRCQNCGSTERLEFHHLHGYNEKHRGGMQQVYGVLRAPDSFLLLCRDCHEELHAIEGIR